MNAVLNERLRAIAAQLDTLRRGGKTEFIRAQAAKLTMSAATL